MHLTRAEAIQKIEAEKKQAEDAVEVFRKLMENITIVDSEEENEEIVSNAEENLENNQKAQEWILSEVKKSYE